ncbi:MAG: FAD-dependent oxidoreductase [Pseudomonadales bacterium]
MAIATYPSLFSPIKIGSMQLPNRIVMSPMTTNYGSPDQEPTERLTAYLEARAKGGVGLITMEVCSVALDHRYQPNSLSLSEDRFIEQHLKITDMIHSHGAKVQPQLTHPGPESMAPFYEDMPGIGPSVNVNPAAHQSCRPLDVEEIPAVIQQYADGAARAKEAGYDGIELHAAHCYMLLGSFLSPLRNARTDEYGGKKLAGRARLLLETLAAIKARVGDDFPVTVSLSGYERSPGGREINESQRLAELLVEVGADAFRVSGGTTDGLVSQMVMGSDYGDAPNLTAASAIRQVVDVPVIVVGRVHTPDLAERIIADGQSDMVAMARPFLADPEWPNKAKSGNAKQIRRCISCENCIDSMMESLNLYCAVNALTGRESKLAITPADQQKRVLVVGAGPAGMEAARVATMRGHTVTLVDRQQRLGGSLVLASTVHSDNEPILHWLIEQVRNADIDIQLGLEANEQYVRNGQFDEVVVATGASMFTPNIPGSEQAHVFSGAQMRRIIEGRSKPADFGILPGFLQSIAAKVSMLAAPKLSPSILRQLSQWYMPIAKEVVIVGTDLAAIELAELLAKRGRRVNMLERGKRIAREIGPKRRAEHMDRLDRLGVCINTEVSCDTIGTDSVSYTTSGGSRREIKAGTVILAGEPVASTELFESIKDMTPNVHAIGDCTGLGLIRKATEEGMRVACSL